MRDFRPYIKTQGWSLRSVWLKVGGVEAHFHRVISGKAVVTKSMAEKIEAATNGLLPVGFLMGITEFSEPAHVDAPVAA